MKLGRIGSVKVPLDVVLGSTEQPVEQVASIGEGTIIELDAIESEPVQLRAGGAIVAYGEVVVIDEHFGVRITSLAKDDNGASGGPAMRPSKKPKGEGDAD